MYQPLGFRTVVITPDRVILTFPFDVTLTNGIDHVVNFEIITAGDTDKAGAGVQQLLRRWDDIPRRRFA